MSLSLRLVVCVAAIALPACQFRGLAFVEDRRIEITAPEYREEVPLPVTVDWDVADFEITGPNGDSREDAGYFAVFADREPQPPGETLVFFGRDDPSCRESEGCPDVEYLAQLRVFTTTDTEFTFESLPPVPGVDLERGERDVHDVTIILLNGRGERIGESSWTITFEVVHDGI